MKNTLKIISISKPLYRLIALLSVLILLSVILGLLSPILSKFIVDEIVLKIQQGGGDVKKLVFLIGLTFVVNIFGALLDALSARTGDHFAGRLQKFLTEQFYYKVLSLPQSYFDSKLSGKIVNQLTRGISAIQGFMNSASNFILPTFLQSIFTILVLTYYSWQTGLFTFLLFPVYMIISYISAKKWGEREVEKNKYEDISKGRIQEVIANIKVVKSFVNEKREYQFVSKSQEKINKIYAKQSRAFHIYDFFRNFSLHIILLAINVVVFYGTFQGALTIGEMVLILQLVVQARIPLFAMSFILSNVQRTESGSKEFFEILDLDAQEDFEYIDAHKKLVQPDVTFNNVSFHYKDTKNVLSNISFTIPAKEKVALVGPSGAGKSTVVNLILKFYDPSKGTLNLGEYNYKDLTHQFVRSHISLVFQENELFSTTIRENVGYGQKVTEKELLSALKKANAYDFVMKLPKKVDTEVGERGVKLSGGQKQRIQIARAILKNSPILILDEATSNLDSKSEHEVQEALKNLMEDKLVIIIAHRLSTIQNVDRIIVLDEGKVVDMGSPKELSVRPGIYQDLLRYQIEGDKKLLQNYEIVG